MPVLSTPLPADLLNAEPTLGTAAPWRLSIAFMNMPPPQEPIDLTLEVRQLVQELFRDANCVTRPERAMIVKFITGNRHNPCPAYGHLASIKLSSHLRNYTQFDNTNIQLFEEEHFEMNFLTGQWRRVKKHRRVE
ncbi:negative elongation factor A-like [Papilio machaon]|uniref:negative elongation factor A-like n=1 Tax=Papilio machaon TaxID=76193 RepID=UPI001E663218|nr:negative elongation factor A-like [Papilio machaon]